MEFNSAFKGLSPVTLKFVNFKTDDFICHLHAVNRQFFRCTEPLEINRLIRNI